VVALLWYNALAGDATGTSIAPFILSEPSVEGYQQNLLDPGDDFRIDTFDTLISFPDVLADGIWVMTAQADARSTDPGFLSFGVGDRPVDVYVAYDAAAARLPGWLDPAAGAFAAVDGQIVTSDGRFDLYRRSYQAGERVVLGGNAADGDGETARMFIPIVVDRTAR
jgi:hypothetical protein